MSRLGEVDVRDWGSYRVTDYQEFSDGRKSMTKIIEIHPYKNISYQFHENREEVWTIIDGICEFADREKIVSMREGDTVYIPKGSLHSVKNVGIIPLKFYEIQIGTELSEDDITRLTRDWSEVEMLLKKFHGKITRE